MSNSAYILCPVYFPCLSLSSFFLILSLLFPFCISSLRYQYFFDTFIYYTIKQLTPYNLYNKFYLTLDTPQLRQVLTHIMIALQVLFPFIFSLVFYGKHTEDMCIILYVQQLFVFQIYDDMGHNLRTCFFLAVKKM